MRAPGVVYLHAVNFHDNYVCKWKFSFLLITRDRTVVHRRQS